MEANQILQSDILDIVFEGKNKSYGAYDLRKTYNGRVSLALLLMFSLIGILFAGMAISKKDTTSNAIIPMISNDNILHKVEPAVIPPIPPPLVKSKQVEKVSSVKYMTLKITPDDEALIPPPTMDEIDKSRIALETFKGDDDLGHIRPPVGEQGTGALAVPVGKKDESDVFFSTVEIEAAFPGGLLKWTEYIKRTILKESDEFGDNDYGTCLIKFKVDKTGKVSDVEAITMKGTKLAEVAVNAIRKGPNWIPAQQNGRMVNAFRVQPVTLKEPDL